MYARINSSPRLASPDRLDEVPSGPKMLPHELPPSLPIHTRQMDCALSLDVPHHLRHCVLRRDRDHHVHVIAHQMPFLDSALLLHRESAKQLPKVLSQLPVQRPATALLDEHHMVFSLPLRVTQTLLLVHRDAPLRVLGGSRGRVSSMDSRIRQTSTVSPAEPGGLLFLARGARAKDRSHISNTSVRPPAP